MPRMQFAGVEYKHINKPSVLSQLLKIKLYKDMNYSCPNWLNDSLTKLSAPSNHPFEIRCSLRNELTQQYLISQELASILGDCSNLIAVYVKKGQYLRERLNYYKSDKRYLALRGWDISTQLLCKMKLICNSSVFDLHSEQAMGLTVGVISRLQKNGFFDVRIIDERLYKDLQLKLSLYHTHDLVHLIALKGLTEDK
ncbi:MAG: hypothetical protein EOO89_31055 [Pedobacter sp.]|nr:MAG: hypothetical protein EOO89_31055 [Pedobacter sp.]